MFNFSANHLFLLSRTEYSSCAVFLLRDLDTQRVYRLHDFTKAQLIRPGVAYCIAGKVNSADKLYLVIESARPDTKHPQCSPVPVPVDGAGGSPIDFWHGQPGDLHALASPAWPSACVRTSRSGLPRVKTQLTMLRFNGLVNRIGGPTDAGELVLV
jgi:hypothetical protein